MAMTSFPEGSGGPVPQPPSGTAAPAAQAAAAAAAAPALRRLLRAGRARRLTQSVLDALLDAATAGALAFAALRLLQPLAGYSVLQAGALAVAAGTAGAVLAVGVLLAVLRAGRRWSLPALASALDRRLNAQELAITAYRLSQRLLREPPGRLELLVLQQAEALAQRVEARRMWPIRPPPRTVLAAPALALAAVLALPGIPERLANWIPAAPPAVSAPLSEEGEALAQMAERLLRQALERGDARGEERARDLLELGRQMQQGGLRQPDRAAARLQQIARELQANASGQGPQPRPARSRLDARQGRAAQTPGRAGAEQAPGAVEGLEDLSWAGDPALSPVDRLRLLNRLSELGLVPSDRLQEALRQLAQSLLPNPPEGDGGAGPSGEANPYGPRAEGGPVPEGGQAPFAVGQPRDGPAPGPAPGLEDGRPALGMRALLEGSPRPGTPGSLLNPDASQGTGGAGGRTPGEPGGDGGPEPGGPAPPGGEGQDSGEGRQSGRGATAGRAPGLPPGADPGSEDPGPNGSSGPLQAVRGTPGEGPLYGAGLVNPDGGAPPPAGSGAAAGQAEPDPDLAQGPAPSATGAEGVPAGYREAIRRYFTSLEPGAWTPGEPVEQLPSREGGIAL